MSMKNNGAALWLLLISQALFLLSSLIDPPSTLLMITLRVALPLIVIAYIGLILAGFISPKKG